jgi:putative transposase
MARLPRIDLPDIAQHIIQRGNNRQPCFADPGDYASYLRELAAAAAKHACAIHAYVLMTNHVHLLATPHEPGAISRMMQAIGRRYVGRFNARYRRTGTLWEGRYKAALVDRARYTLACYRYIELNPVRAGMVVAPGDYRWSSHAHNALGLEQSFVTPHSTYLALDPSGDARRKRYCALFDKPPPTGEMNEIRRYTQQQRVYGSTKLRRQVAALIQRATTVRPRGRPRAESIPTK